MAEKVKIKLLAHGTGLGDHGEVVDVPKPVADVMCSWRKMHNGHCEVDYRTAQYADEVESELEPKDMTASEMAAAGRKNVVSSPKDDVGAVSEVATSLAGKRKRGPDKAVERMS